MKNTVRRLACLFIYVIIYAELAACSTQPAIVNGTSQHAEKINTQWKKGKEQAIQGEKLRKTGEEMIIEGREKIRKGEAAKAEGQKLIESGMQLMDESLRNSAD